MDKYKIYLSTQATNDLRDIYNYIHYNLSSPLDANKQVIKIKEAIAKLDTFPNRHPSIDFEPWNIMQLHKLPIGNYIIIYLINDDVFEVDITRILYKGKNIELTLKKC